jgi:hypothetical protein
MRAGEIVHAETLEDMRKRTRRNLDSLPVELRSRGEKPTYLVRHSAALMEAARALASAPGG